MPPPFLTRIHVTSSYNRWLRQHLEEGDVAADTQPPPGEGGGDSKAKVRWQKSKDKDATPNLLLKHPDATLTAYV
jgi:hypothetical protein